MMMMMGVTPSDFLQSKKKKTKLKRGYVTQRPQTPQSTEYGGSDKTVLAL